MTDRKTSTPRDDRGQLGSGFDPDVLRRKYRAERDARLRLDGVAQYREVAGDLARFADDPNADSRFQRPPIDEATDVLVVGGGFGGLTLAAHLRRAGIASLRIVEQGSDFGGAWYWNRYPGAQCDMESYIYLPLLEETGYVPQERYSFGPEILAHAQRIGRIFDLYRVACFQTRVTDMRWNPAARRWLVETDREDRFGARFVVVASGPLNRPKLPAIPGIERFGGRAFHTSRWDYAYTGGGPAGNLDKLVDKQVAIVGTGATAVQCVPHLARHAEHLFVFQRTPSSVDERGNRPTPADFAATLAPGWQRQRMENFNNLVCGVPQSEDMVSDGWTEIFRTLTTILPTAHFASLSPDEMERVTELADFEKMNALRGRVDAVVKDPATADALKPWYRQFCKRPTFNDDYLPTFNRPNVTLVDTRGRGVDRMTTRGLVVGEREYVVDCIVFATGFEVATSYTRRAGFDIVGRGGRALSAHWRDGMRTFHGFASHGFPNCFHLGATQTGFTANVPHMLLEQSVHLTDLIATATERGLTYLEPSAEAEAEWVETIREKSRARHAFLSECTPGYYNNEGTLSDSGFGDLYGGGPIEFFALLRAWRGDGTMSGFAVA